MPTQESKTTQEQLRYSHEEICALIVVDLITKRPDLGEAQVSIKFGVWDSDPYYPQNNVKTYHADVTTTVES